MCQSRWQRNESGKNATRSAEDQKFDFQLSGTRTASNTLSLSVDLSVIAPSLTISAALSCDFAKVLFTFYSEL